MPQSVCLLYSGAAESALDRNQTGDVASNDLVIVEGSAPSVIDRLWPLHRRAAILAKTVLYFDWWGCAYDKRPGPMTLWHQPGPRDLTPGLNAFKAQAWPYLMDDDHMERLLGQVLTAADSHPDAAGIFLDDFQDVAYWDLTDAQRDLVWGGRHSSHPLFRAKMVYAERILRFLLNRIDMGLWVNGNYRQAGARMWESLGEWVSPSDLEAGARPGDMVLVKGIASDRESWLSTRTEAEHFGGYPGGTSFRQVFLDLLELAERKSLTVGLCLGEYPLVGGGSKATVHRYTNPNTWGAI